MAGADTLSCAWCGRPFEAPSTRGPTPRYCRRACRQRAYEHRRAQPGTPAAIPSADALAALAAATARAVAGSRGNDVQPILDVLVAAAQRVLTEAGRSTVPPGTSDHPPAAAGSTGPSTPTPRRRTRGPSKGAAH